MTIDKATRDEWHRLCDSTPGPWKIIERLLAALTECERDRDAILGNLAALRAQSAITAESFAEDVRHVRMQLETVTRDRDEALTTVRQTDAVFTNTCRAMFTERDNLRAQLAEVTKERDEWIAAEGRTREGWRTDREALRAQLDKEERRFAALMVHIDEIEEVYKRQLAAVTKERDEAREAWRIVHDVHETELNVLRVQLATANRERSQRARAARDELAALDAAANQECKP